MDKIVFSLRLLGRSGKGFLILRLLSIRGDVIFMLRGNKSFVRSFVRSFSK